MVKMTPWGVFFLPVSLHILKTRYYVNRPIVGKAISGEWGLDDEAGTGIPVLRTTNFTNEGIINFSDVVTRTINKKRLITKIFAPW